MGVWWNHLSTLERFLAGVALPASLLLIIQTVLMFFGMGEHDSDAPDTSGLDTHTEFDHDIGEHDFDISDHDMDSGHVDHDGYDSHSDHDMDGHSGHEGHGFTLLRFLSVRGMITFATLMGWTGLACLQSGMRPFGAVFVGVTVGLAGMAATGWLLAKARKMAVAGTMDLKKAVGCTATVYIRIPAGRQGAGKVNVLFEDQLHELDAYCDEREDLKPDKQVLVVGCVTQNSLLVVPKK